MAEELSFEEEMARARESLSRREEEVTQQIEPEEEPPAEVPALGAGEVPAIGETSRSDLTPERPRTFEEEMALARGEELPDTDQNTGFLGDVGTDIKIGASMIAKGPMIRAEKERDFRDQTKNKVAEQLTEPDIAGIEKIAGKKIDKMDWFELNNAATDFYGTTGEGFLGKRFVWNNMLREMMGFREGDKDRDGSPGLSNLVTGEEPREAGEPTGAPAFEGAYELISGSLRSNKANVLTGAVGVFKLDGQAMYEGIARPIMESTGVDSREKAEAAAKALDELYLEYTDEMQEQEQKTFINPEATKNPLTWFSGDDTKSWKGILHTTLQQGPMLLLMAGASKGGGMVGASRYTRSMRTPLQTMEEVQKIQKTGATIGGAAAGGMAEMSMIRDGVFTEVNRRIENETSDEMWANNEHYSRLVAGGMTPEEAKQIVGYSYANSAGEMAMVISGALLGTPMGAFYGQTVGRSAGRQQAKQSILAQMGRGALYETGQEMAQEGTEQIASNLAVMRINPEAKVFDDVLEAMAAAAFTSAPYGAISGIGSDKGAGVAKDYDKLVNLSQPWMNAANERWKFQNKKGPNTSFANDASPQDQRDAMIELERLQEKEAEAFDKVRTETYELMERNGADKEKLLEHKARADGYRLDLAMIAKRRKARQIAKKQAAEEKRALAERAAAKAQVERDVFTIEDNTRLVEGMQAIQRGEEVHPEMYDELSKMGYGTFDQRGTKFILTQRGARGLEELATQASDLKDKLEAGFTGADRRVDSNLRDAYQNLTEQEFEDQVMRDDDTRLWNKRKWNQDKDKSVTINGVEQKKSVAVLDVDALKWVNDNMSHSAGTKLLRTVAKEIESLGSGAESYRYGGDEFIVTHPDPDKLQSMVEQAIARVNALPRMEEAGKSIKIQVSVGYGQDFDTADVALNQEKDRRIASGERVDSRVEGATPPSLRLTEPDNSPQMTLFAMSKDYKKFDDDQIHKSDNNTGDPEYWDEYVSAGDLFYNSQVFGTRKVSEQEMGWIEGTIEDYLPSTNQGNPPVTLMHDYTWLSEISPNQYEEMLSMPFGAQNVRGIFSMDDPSHGVFLFADAIIAEVRRGLKSGNKIGTWNGIKYKIKEGDTVEIIDGKGKIRKAKVTDFTIKKPKYSYGTTSFSGAEKRLQKEAIDTRQRINKLIRKEESLLKARLKMSEVKREDRDHPINKQLAENFENQGQLEQELRMFQSALARERQARWKRPTDENVDRGANSLTVELDGDVLVFDPEMNSLIRSTDTEASVNQKYNIGYDWSLPTNTFQATLSNGDHRYYRFSSDGDGNLMVMEKVQRAYKPAVDVSHMIGQSPKAIIQKVTNDDGLDFHGRTGDVLEEALGKVPNFSQRSEDAKAKERKSFAKQLKIDSAPYAEERGDIYLGQIRHAKSSKWYDNFGNEEASKDEEMTRKHVEMLVADTVMHETVGHFGIRGITKDYESYIKLTHAMVDAFPEVAEALRWMGYTYRTDINKGEDLDRANKALLGEEIMAWKAGELLSNPELKGMTLPQQSAIRRFITWFKEQLIQLGWGKVFRKYKAAQIRAARRRLYNPTNAHVREQAFIELYGKGDQAGLIHSGQSAERTGAWKKGKKTKRGVVIRAADSFLTDNDLLNIIARSHDAIVNGHSKWTFKDFHGQPHNLYMRDMEIFRKPIYEVMVNGVRGRTEEEVLSEEDLAPAPPVPTLAEAYKEATGEDMPEGWKPLTPGDFKDAAKEMMAEKGELFDEYQAAREAAGGKLGPPVFLYQKETGGAAGDNVAGKVQSIISKAKKEKVRRENLVRAKKAKIEAGERMYGESFNQDRIPIFPEVATLQGFIEAAKQALPSAKNKGFISEMEMEAAGFMEQLWPSRFRSIVIDLFGGTDPADLSSRLGISEKRIKELRNPGQQMTEEEANAVSKLMKETDSQNSMFYESQVDPKNLMQNNNLILSDFIPVLGQYALSQQDPALTTLNILLGENHAAFEAYLKAVAKELSDDPDERSQALMEKQEILSSPIDVTKIQIPKDWVLDRIKDPVYDVSVSAPIRVPTPWKTHYERLYGEKPPAGIGNDFEALPAEQYQAIREEQRRDEKEGPNIGYDEQLGRWITTKADHQTQNYYSNLMPLWTVPGSYKGAVFWQRPEGNVDSYHFEFAHYRERSESAEAMGEMSGIWGHVRYGESIDADPNAPIAPNPDKQGRAMLFAESQADYIQRAAKRYSSSAEEHRLTQQYLEDGRALKQMFGGYMQAINTRLRTAVEEDFQNIVDRVDDSEMESFYGENQFALLSDHDKEVLKQIVAANHFYNQVEELPAINEFNEAIDSIRDSFEWKRLKRAARDQQPQQQTDDLGDSGDINKTKLKTTFVGDARMFEWADHRAMDLIFTSIRDLSTQYHQHIIEQRTIGGPGTAAWDKLVANGGKIMNLSPDNRVDTAIAAHVLANAKSNGNNQPGHRLPFMSEIAIDRLALFIADFEQRGERESRAEAESIFESISNQQSYVLNLDLDALASQFNESEINARSLQLMLNDFRGTPFGYSYGLLTKHVLGNTSLSAYGTKDQLDTFDKVIIDELKEYMKVRFAERSMEDLNKKIYDKKQTLNNRWDYGRMLLQHWLGDFQVEYAKLRVSDDPNAPFEHVNDELANGMSIERAREMIAEHDIESFDKYVKRKWEELWNNSTTAEIESYEQDGGDSDTPTPNWYERYAESYNDRPPGVFVMQVPVQWETVGDVENEIVETVEWVVKRPSTDRNRWTIFIDGEEKYDSVSNTHIINKITMYIRDYYDHQNITAPANGFPSLRPEIKAINDELKSMENRKAEGELQSGAEFAQAFSESVDFDVQRGEFGDMEESFLRIIESNKKSGWQERVLIEKNEQWRTAQILYGFSEAVRNGYARMHLPWGSQSGSRGGYGRSKYESTSYVHSTNEIEYELSTQVIRGERRDILIVKPDNTEDSMWIDVTSDNLIPMNPDRTISDNPDQYEGYFSGEITKQLGRDVAETIARKMSSSNKAAKRNLLMVSKTSWNPDTTGQQELMDSYFIHDTQGNIIEIAASREEANARREELTKEDQTEAPTNLKGTVTSGELGGPIQIPRTYYAGSPAYRADYGSGYQHTFARPSYEGGRANYDLVMPARINGHLKRFGLKIEEGYAKVEDQHKVDSMYGGGDRISYMVPQSLVDQYPNIRIDQVGGENFGFIINSDRGVVMPTIFSTKEAAEVEMDGWYRANSADDSGRVKVYQVTFNDDLRKFHERPQNPYLGIKYQINSNEKLKEALSKIGSNEPSLLERFLDWRKTWKASVNIGMFDRFYGILHALKMTGSSTEGYILTRMSTGLDSIMKGVFEYGHPVWRDGVVVNEGRGLLKILEPVADQVELWAGYMAGKRAKGLMLEGYNKLNAHDKSILDREAGNYEGEDFNERLFNLLVDVTDVGATDKPAMITRRDILKGMAALGVAANVPMPGNTSLEKAAIELVLPMLKKSNFKKFRNAAGRAQRAARTATTAEAMDLDRIVDPTKAFRKPEQARYTWVKKLMESDGVTREQAEEAIDSAIKKGFEDQMAADIAKAAKEKSDKKTRGTSSPDVNRVVNNMIAQGRESLFTPTDIKELIALGDDFPIFDQVSEDYASFNKKMLDFAEESGVINSETRPLWEDADYIPFYRIADDRLVGPLAKTAGVANQKSPIDRLKGGQNNLGDLVHNIFMNATNLMDSSVKNNAALEIVNQLEPTGMMVKEKFDPDAQVPMEDIKKILKRNNIELDDLEAEVQKGLQTMFAVQAPKGDGVVSVLRDGKKEFYRVDDPLLYRSMAAINMERLPDWVAPARFAKRFQTTMITIDPGFMAANFIRDSMSAFVLSRDNFIPMVDGVRGFKEAITEGDTYQAMVASGAAFESGIINQGDPKATHKYIKRAMRDAGFQRTLLNTPRKLFNAWKKLGSATENANRIAVYQAAIKAGKTQQQALYEAKDIMDFSMSGDYKAIQYLIQTVPFMGARMQGLHRLGRGAKENPVGFLIKGTMIGVAGMGLWLRYRDDPRYDELEDWDKDAYFHWWIGDLHFRLPKGFEVGAIFNTIPERIFEYYYSRETDAGKHLMRRMGHMFLETFNMNPIPQIAKPPIEAVANYDFFRGRSVESPYEKDLLPEDRYANYTSETMREMAMLFPQGWSTKWYGEIKSPKKLEHMWAGYTGTMGRYMLNAADIGMRVLMDYPVQPDWDASDLPVLSRFFRGDRPRRTRYEEEFYRELHDTVMVMNSMRKADRAGEDGRYDELEAFFPDEVDRARELQGYSRELQRLRKEAREVYADRDITKEEKRSELDDIQREKNEVMKEAYESRPGAAPKDEEVNLETLMDTFDPTSPDGNQEMKVQAPETTQLFAGVTDMSPAQLHRLEKADNYRPTGNE